MEKSKAEEWEMEGMGLWPYSRKAKTGQVARYHQVSARAKHLRAMGNGLVKREDWKRALQNLFEAH